jgi:capsid protein
VDERFIRGANIQYLKVDEEIELLASNRPTQNMMSFGNELIRDICQGTELNYEIVWSLMELGGANSRIVLADAQWFFDQIQDALNEMFNQRVWVWWCASMMNNRELRICRDPRWWTCHWQGPPKLTADAGRAIQGDVLALQNGMLNWEDYHDARGADYQDKIGRQIKALSWAKSQCDKAGVPFEYIFSLKPGTPTSVAGGQSNVGGAVE